MRTLHTAAAVAAALVGMAFSMATAERWLARRKPHELAWSVSLAMFAVAAAALAAGSQLGWNGPIFRAFYLFGAILNVPFLALGSVYLLAKNRRTADVTAVVVCLLAAFAAGILVATPLTADVPRDEFVQGKAVFGVLPRVLAAVASGLGALVVFAGAAWSAVRIRRGRMVAANALIALGTAILSASGLLNSVLDEMTGFSVTLVLGITVLFCGFLVATSGGPAQQPVVAAPGPPELSAGPDEAASRRDRGATTART